MHSVFSPSKSHRFMACTASHALEQNYPDSYSDAAREGSRAHALAEHCLNTLTKPSQFKNGSIIEHDKGNGETAYEISETNSPNIAKHAQFDISDDMVDAVSIYYEYVLAKQVDIEFSAERRIDIIPDLCYGTADCVFIRDTTLYIIDFKYGAGVGVSAKNNEQLMCYALGVMRASDTPRRAKLIIIQPRHRGGRIDEWVISREDLESFGVTLSQTIQDIENEKVSFSIGNHCKFCKAQGDCPEKAKVYTRDYDNRKSLSIVDILNKADEIREWLKAVEQSAFDRLRSGERIEGWKLIDRQARSKIRNEKEAIEQLESLGYSVSEKSILAIGKLKKIVPDNILSQYVIKESSGKVLAKENDPRSETDLGKDF